MSNWVAGKFGGVSWLEFLDGIGKGLVGLLGPFARVVEFLQGGLRVWG